MYIYMYVHVCVIMYRFPLMTAVHRICHENMPPAALVTQLGKL